VQADVSNEIIHKNAELIVTDYITANYSYSNTGKLLTFETLDNIC